MMAFLRRNAVHIAMAALFIIVAMAGLALWDQEGTAIWINRVIAYCT